MNDKSQIDALQNKVGKGLHWGLLDIMSNKLVAIASAVIVTRQLLPEDFGLYSVATAFIGMAMMFTFTGFDSAIIHKGEVDARDLNTAWSLELAKNLFLGILVYFSAPYIEILMDIEGVTPVIEMVSFIFPIYGLRNIGLVLLRKELNMKRQYVFNTVPQVITAIVTVYLAYTLRNVWALVYGYLFGAIVSMILSYVIHPFRPRFQIQLARLQELFHFGKWMFLSSIINFFKKQGVILVIGRFWGADILGYYNRSAAFSINIFAHLQKLFPKIVFPVFSKIKANPKLLSAAFADTLRSTTFLVSFITGLGFAFSHELVTLLIGERWISIVPFLRIMFIITLVELALSPFNALFTAIGKPRINTITGLLRITIIMFTAIPAVLLDNFYYIIYSILLADVGALLTYVIIMSSIVGTKKRRIIANLSPAFLACTVLILGSLGLDTMLSTTILIALGVKLGLLLVFSGVIFLVSEKWLNLRFHRFIKLIVPGSDLSQRYIGFLQSIHIYPLSI